jgi:hypothetical protein
MMGGLNALPLSGNVASPTIDRRVSFNVGGGGTCNSAHAADTDKAVDAIRTASRSSTSSSSLAKIAASIVCWRLTCRGARTKRSATCRRASSMPAFRPAGTLPGLINSRSWLPPNAGKYFIFISVDKSQKALYNMLPLLSERSANSTRGRRPQSSGTARPACPP